MSPRVLSKEEFQKWVEDIGRCCDSCTSFSSQPMVQRLILTIEARDVTIRELEETVGRFQQIVNYWFPRLGYSKANEMAYPALGDDRATEPKKSASAARSP